MSCVRLGYARNHGLILGSGCRPGKFVCFPRNSLSGREVQVFGWPCRSTRFCQADFMALRCINGRGCFRGCGSGNTQMFLHHRDGIDDNSCQRTGHRHPQPHSSFSLLLRHGGGFGNKSFHLSVFVPLWPSFQVVQHAV